jgi:hypothetical protein
LWRVTGTIVGTFHHKQGELTTVASAALSQGATNLFSIPAGFWLASDLRVKVVAGLATREDVRFASSNPVDATQSLRCEHSIHGRGRRRSRNLLFATPGQE